MGALTFYHRIQAALILQKNKKKKNSSLRSPTKSPKSRGVYELDINKITNIIIFQIQDFRTKNQNKNYSVVSILTLKEKMMFS